MPKKLGTVQNLLAKETWDWCRARFAAVFVLLYEVVDDSSDPQNIFI